VPIDLAELVAPDHTAVVTMELQRGVVGDHATLGELAAACEERGVVASAARVVEGARAAGAKVVHCTAEFRPDRAGSSDNSPLQRAIAKGPPNLLIGTEAADVVPELGPDPSDVVTSRIHGLTPFPGTELDAILRNLGVSTVVACGVSVNIGVLGLVLGAVDLGYRVALVTDAVAGVPPEYGDDVVRHTLALLATLVTADDVLAAWKSG
jgi:nicotinamidase-related amidase